MAFAGNRMGKRKDAQVLSTRAGATVAVWVGIALVAVLIPLAHAAETTRAEYKATVEPICKENTMANERILAGARKKVKQGKLKAAAAKFGRAATALMKTYRELNAVPKPAADANRLSKWLAYVKTEAELLRRASRALRAGEIRKVESLVARLTHNANLANSQVVTFGFRYCQFEPSKYT